MLSTQGVNTMHNENLPKISEPFNHPKEQGYYYTRLGLNSDEESGDIRYVEDFKDEDGIKHRYYMKI